MANKPFAIQGADLTLGGVNIQAGTTGVVIPGITQATTFIPEEVEKVGDDSSTWLDTPVIIDQYTYLVLLNQRTPPQGWTAPEYLAVLDDTEIDEINIVDPGAGITDEIATIMGDNIIAAPAGSSVDPQTFDSNVWVAINWTVKCRAGEIETIGGGGGINFDEDDAINLQGNGIIRNTGDSEDVNIVASGFAQLQWTTDAGVAESNPNNTNEPLNWIYVESDGAHIETNVNSDGDRKEWIFSTDGSLEFPDGTIQTTAYTGQSGGTSTAELWIAGGESPGGAAILTSTDGITWTTQDYMMGGQNIIRVAIGANKIVYLMSLDGQPGSAIYYTNAPETTPALAVGTDSYNSNPVYWEEINYLGGKFVAVGSYESNGNTVSTGIVSVDLAGGSRTYPQITLNNIDYNFSNVSITITGATNNELNGTFILQYNSLDTIRTGVYDLTLDGGGVPTITSTDTTGATVADLTNVNGTLPIFAYSTNGVSWTYGDIDPGYFTEVGGAEQSLEMSDVAYDGTGYLIPVLSNSFDNGSDPTAYGPGAFYITDLTAQVSSGQWIPGSGLGSLPGNGNNIASYGDGTFFVCDDQYTVWTGSPVDGWTPHNLKSAQVTAYGWEPELGNNNDNDVDSAVAGTVGLNQCWAGTTNEGMVVSTTDQGATFQFSIPEPITTTATFDGSGPAMIDFAGGATPNQWEKITLAVAEGDDTSWNGTYYVSLDSGTIWTLYDAPEGSPIDGGTWTAPSNPFNITLSQGVDLDAIHIADNACIVYSGNSNKLYRSTDLTTWTVVSNESNYWVGDIYFASNQTSSTDTLAAGEFEFVLNTDGTLTFPSLTVSLHNGGNQEGQVLQFGNPSQQAIITGPTPATGNNAERLIIQGQDGGTGEGGDVYVWAGDAVTDGGDIKIYAGDADSGSEGYGGYVNISGGDGYTEGGHVHIDGGYSNNGTGGDVRIQSGGSGNNLPGKVEILADNKSWQFKPNGELQLPAAGDIVDSNGDSVLGNASELIGDGSTAGTGFTRIVYTDWDGGQGGESMSMGGEDWFATSDVTGVEIGDTITFQQGEVRTISGITVAGDHAVVTWSGGTVTGSTTLPRYPVTITTSDYAEPVRNIARIKPDNTAADDYDQYVDVYAGQVSSIIDSKHIHMAGHTGEIELFLGTDNNYVATKEAGTAPAGVRLHSENDVSVESSNLRINRKGSSWAAVYGDGKNYNQEVHNSDLTFGPVAVDEHGDYYVGGEHCWTADAIISKYGRDGNLIWSKYNSGPDVVGWDVKAIAYHNGEVATVTSTNQGRSEFYIKLTVQDSTTGEIKSTRDIYDTDGSVDARSMCYHSTLGWVVAGRTWGETATSGTKSAGSGSGVGVIEVPLIGIQFDGTYPKPDTDWYVTGTGITGRQYLQNGTGRYSDLPITSVTGGGSSATARVTVDYNTGAYSYLTVQTQGSGYNTDDELKIPGSLLGGVDAMTSVTATPFSVNPGTNIMVQFDQTTYPDLYDQLKWASYTVSYNAGTHNVLNIVDSGDGYWNVTIEGSDTNLSVATFYTANGNDLTFLAQVSGDLLVGPNSALTGVASRKTLRLEMSNMGYGSTDFAGASFTFSRYLNSQPWVWTSSWTRYLNQSGDADTMSSGSAYTVVEDTYSGGVYVGGYIVDASNHSSFVWKLTASGTTSWVEALGIDTGGVGSIAVSTVDGSVYATSESIGTSSINKLDTNGALLIRKSPNGMWGVDAQVKLEIGLDGLEYVYVGGQGSAVWIGPTYALMVNKFTSALDPIWGREMYYQGGEGLSTNYNDTYNTFVLGKGQASVVGYTNMFGVDRTNAAIFTLDTTDEFVPVSDNNWVLGTNTQLAWALDTSTTIVDLLAAGVEAETSSVLSDVGGLALALIEWTFQERVINLNNTANGIVGVETINFASGGVLDHNPSDIPPSVGFDSQSGWNYTLQLSDRGRFIINQPVPNDSYAENLTILVPRNDQVSFPVGTVITLINTSSAGAGGYVINVEPVNYLDDNAARIWSTNGGQNPSTWSFQGIQTATLMKISTNGWLLTANDITNTD